MQWQAWLWPEKSHEKIPFEQKQGPSIVFFAGFHIEDLGFIEKTASFPLGECPETF